MPPKFYKDHVSSPARGYAATVTLVAPPTNFANVIWHIAWSYSGTPTNGYLLIQDGTATVFELDITAAGPGTISFPTGVWCDPVTAATVTLYAVDAVYGKLNVQATVEYAR